MMEDSRTDTPQIKICGITTAEQAEWCAELRADAIGCVFFPKSPRHLPDQQARDICRVLPDWVTPVGVFVNATFSEIMKRVEGCGLKAVQLHGIESPELVLLLKKEGLIVIKALFIDGDPSLNVVETYNANGYLIECSGGPLPGGNALVWNWDWAKPLGKTHPMILAGGLSPENISQAIEAAAPDAVDVSSGVESSPGTKDRKKIEDFINAVRRTNPSRPLRIIY